MKNEIKLAETDREILEIMDTELREMTGSHYSRFKMGLILACSQDIPKTNLKIRDCVPSSLRTCFLKFAMKGLIPGTPEGYILPFESKGKYIATFIPGVRGLEKLVHKNYDNVISSAVYRNDEFTPPYTTMNGKRINHKVAVGDRGEMIGAYCMVSKVKQGVILVDCEFMDCSTIWQAVIKGRSKGQKVPHPSMLSVDTIIKNKMYWLYSYKSIYEKGSADQYDLINLGMAWSDYYPQMARNRVTASVATRSDISIDDKMAIMDSIVEADIEYTTEKTTAKDLLND